MRTAFTIAWKDLRGIYRTPSALALMLIAPLVVATILGAAFGGGGNFQLQAVKTAVTNLSSSHGASAVETGRVSASSMLVKTLRSSGLQDILDVTVYQTAAAARGAVDDGKSAVAVIIPEGFDQAVTSATGATSSVELYEDPTQQIGPGIVRSVVDQVLGQFNGARAAAMGAAAVATKAGAASGGIDMARIQAAAQRAAAKYAAAGAGGVTFAARPPKVAGGTTTHDPGITGVVLAGQLVFFSLFGAATAARTILVEQQQGTLPRLFTTPSSRTSILGGKFVAAFMVVLVQTIVILVAGWLIFSIYWGTIVTVVVLALAGSIVASGLAMLVGSLSRTLAQQGAIGAGVYLVLALLGGNFTGSFATSGASMVLRRITPNGWLLEAWDTAMRGGTIADIGLPILMVLAFSAVFFAAAVLVLRRRFA